MDSRAATPLTIPTDLKAILELPGAPNFLPYLQNFGPPKPDQSIQDPTKSTSFKPTVTGEDVVIYEDWDDAAVHGNTIWDAGLALGKFFSWWHKKDGALEGAKILELGAGTGVTGLSLCKLGARVILTDNMEEVLALMRRNVRVNDLGESAEVMHLDWADVTTYQLEEPFDFVIAADVLYEGYGGPILAKAFEAHVAMGSKTIGFFAFRKRTEAPLSFFDTMARMGFFIERLEDDKGRCVGDTHGTSNSAFDGTRFVELPVDGATQAVKDAVFVNNGSIQIFRLTRRHACPPGLMSDEGPCGAGYFPPIWRVTAEGLSKGGLLVRSGQDLKSRALEDLLMKGSRVAQVQVVGNRMSYRKVSGDGPERGWVSLAFKGTPLLSQE